MKEIRGLSSSEVIASRERFGTNALSEKKRKTLWQKYWEKFDDPVITVLLVALGINVVFTFFGKVDWFECAGIFISVLIATWVSALSEFKNEETFQKIQKEASDISCKVYRDGKVREIPIGEIVRGDAVLLQAGDMIPADGYVFSGSATVDQAVLNGENKEIKKTERKEDAVRRDGIDFWDKSGLYRGAVVCSGQCIMTVEEVGDETVYGKMNLEAGTDDRKSPLQVKLTALAKAISKFGYIGAILVMAIYIFTASVVNNGYNSGEIFRYFSDAAQVTSDFVSAAIMGIVVVVLAVPEGLPLMVAIVCSLNMKKMMKDKVLVRKLIGIETAGSVNILFTDKTGTITCGKLRAESFTDGEGNTFSSFENIPDKLAEICYFSAVKNSMSQISDNKIIGGNSTEKALVSFVTKNLTDIRKVHCEKLQEKLFSSEDKYSACEVKGDFNGILVKGAPEKVLRNCRRYYDGNGNVRVLESICELEAKTQEMAEKSIRVIALAVSDGSYDGKMPENLILVGLVGIRDSLRAGVEASVREVKRAGIQVVMITGDKKETALAVARESGIVDNKSDVVLTSDELREMSDAELKKLLPSVRVISRALPIDKSRLVRVAQENGLVVGMTGDGVNDLSALKCADVGFAMGSGADVAKEAGDIVILDDNFSSVRKAVLYGRTIYKSIKKFIAFQLTINVAAVAVSVFGPLFGIIKPFGIAQMLWINLVMDALAAIAFGGEPALCRYMLEKPKSRTESIVDKKMWSAIICGAVFICLTSIFMFMSQEIHYAFRAHPDDTYFYTGYFSYFILTCIFNAFNIRTDEIDLTEKISLNKPFLFIMLLICVVQVIMTYFGGALLRTAGLSIREWVLVTVMALLIIPVDILRKIVVNRKV